MFDLFSASHLLIIGIAILLFVGPKDLPRLMRAAGKWTRKIRGVANEFRQTFEDMGHEAELVEIRNELKAFREAYPEPERPHPQYRVPAMTNQGEIPTTHPESRDDMAATAEPRP